MSLQLLKFLTVLSYLLITFDTGHIGGQFGIYLVLGLMSGGINSILTLAYLLLLIAIVVSAFRPFKNDYYFFLFSGVLLCIPIFTHSNFYPRFNVTFCLTAFMFFFFYLFTLIKMRKKYYQAI